VNVAKGGSQTALIAKYNALAAPLADRVVRSITADITRANNATGESKLGDVIFDAQLDATNDPGFGDAVVAFMSPGGIRADLTYAPSGGELPGEVTYGEMFTVQPFGNSMVTMTLTGGADRKAARGAIRRLHPGERSRAAGVGRLHLYLEGVGPVCDKVDPATIVLNGVAVDPSASYWVTVNSLLADGGDSFPILTQGTNRLGGAIDTDALEAYLTAFAPVAPGPQNRITVVP
jgi:5'-nucleotidase